MTYDLRLTTYDPNSDAPTPAAGHAGLTPGASGDRSLTFWAAGWKRRVGPRRLGGGERLEGGGREGASSDGGEGNGGIHGDLSFGVYSA